MRGSSESGVAAIEIPLPDEAERLAFIQHELKTSPFPEGSMSRPKRWRNWARD
jgi:hypothetical protein